MPPDTTPATAPLAGPSRPRIMGILNVTPDSFSDGGTFERADEAERTRAAVESARALVRDGASLIDVGGESTRPGAARVPQAEEAARVLPIVEALASEGIPVSIDTMNAATAREALALTNGSAIINDVSGGQADEAMLPLMAQSGATYILSHWRGHSIVMNELADYADPAAEILAELADARGRAVRAGLDPERIVLDPGLGFAKRADDNWAVLRDLELFSALGPRLLIGHSRKRFLGAFAPEGAPAAERDLATAIVSALVAARAPGDGRETPGAAPVWGLRVHNVAATRVALDLVDAIRNGAHRA